MSEKFPGWPEGAFPASICPATVVSNKDTLKQGRVQIRVPALHGAQDDDARIQDADLPWAKPCFPFAGGGSGLLGVPPVGAGVFVAFIMGSPDHPVWLGSWIGNGDAVSEHEDGYENSVPKNYVLKSLGGHVLKLSDKTGGVEIEILTKDGNRITLSDTNKQVQVQSKDGHKLTIADTPKTITLETVAGQKVVLDDTATEVQVTAATRVVIKADAQITLDANTLIEALSNLVELGIGASEAAVKESSLLALFNAHVHTSAAAGAPTTPPTVPIPPGVIGSTKVKVAP